SIGFAAQNLMLAFRAKGYDTCPMGGIDPTRIKRLLKLGYGDEVSLVIGAGRRAEGGLYGPRLRFPRERFIHEV
ncbi:nitroreductase family protein, partial [Myxococcota bacterium]|nr:nitroreductase family protein [Myxococcota bacterium]